MLSIHTLEARDNVLLDIALGPQHGYSGDEVRRQIGLALNDATTALRRRGIAYDRLRTALTPQVGKKEIALLFDSARMGSWYGYEAGEAVLPLLNPATNHSILCGDILWKNQDTALDALNSAGTFWRPRYIGHLSQLYCVYLNNLSLEAFNALASGLRGRAEVAGFVDCTFSSSIKSILATCLSTRYVKTGRKFITSHPVDANTDANENSPGWPLEQYGYEFLSIDDTSFDLFLAYKIESSFAPLTFNDGHFSMIAATGIWRDPREIPISVDDAKREYLQRNKAGSMAKAGLEDLTSTALATELQRKIAQSYIFSLTWNSELNFSNFATMIEFEHDGRRSRLRAALKYENDELGLITLYG